MQGKKVRGRKEKEKNAMTRVRSERDSLSSAKGSEKSGMRRKMDGNGIEGGGGGGNGKSRFPRSSLFHSLQSLKLSSLERERRLWEGEKSRAVTAKKFTKKCNARAELFFIISY